MRHRGRLRRLGVRVRRKHGMPMTLRHVHERPAQQDRRLQQSQHELAKLHAIHRHVDVVAAARGVQPARDGVAAVATTAFQIEEQSSHVPP
jgi:hypothetical protein